MKRKDFIRRIEAAGWVFDPASRHAGHDQYTKGGVKFAVPRHKIISATVVGHWEKLDR